MNVMDVDKEGFGEFDYITAHGLFAWVPAEVREKVMGIFSEMLAPAGVGYLSYNAYPGAHAREMVRSMLRFHTEDIDDPQAKVDSAIDLLGLLAKGSADREVSGRILEFEQRRHSEHLAADIFHDDLGEIYRPFYFHEFAALLKANGLQFLSEAELHASSTQGLGHEAVTFLESVDDREKREQYLDFFRGRVFRQTLFCRDGEKLAPPGPSVLDKLYLSSTLRPAWAIERLSAQKVEVFRTAKGQQIQIDHPLTKAAFEHLGEIWGRSILTTDLLAAACERLGSEGASEVDEQVETARSIILRIALATDMIELHSYAPDGHVKMGYKPKVDRLAAWQLRDANNVLTRLNKDLKLNDLTSRRLLELMDGTRSQIEIERDLRPFIKTAADLDEESKKDLLGSLKSWIENSIAELSRLGLFEA
jgi:hypothetical protein